MNQKEIKELIEFLIEKDIAEFELERGDVKVRIKRAAPEPRPVERIISIPTPVAVQAPMSAAEAAAPTAAVVPAAPAEKAEELQMVKSPMVGTYYESPSPGRSEEHTSELQSHSDLVCRLLLEKKKKKIKINNTDKK